MGANGSFWVVILLALLFVAWKIAERGKKRIAPIEAQERLRRAESQKREAEEDLRIAAKSARGEELTAAEAIRLAYVAEAAGIANPQMQQLVRTAEALKIADADHAMAVAAAKSVQVSVTTYPSSDYRQTDEDKRFEDMFLREYGHMLDKHFFVRVAGVTFRNPDGTDRRKLVEKCAAFDQVRLKLEPDNPADSHAVAVLNMDGQCLGYLKRETAAQVSQDFEASSRIWFAVVRRVTPATGDVPIGLVLCIYRLSEEFVREHIDCGASDAANVPMIRTGVGVTFMSSASE